jgi:hypothetical protein
MAGVGDQLSLLGDTQTNILRHQIGILLVIFNSDETWTIFLSDCLVFP